MKNFLSLLLIVSMILISTSLVLFGQSDPRYNSITLFQDPPAPLPIGQVTATPSATGANTYYYWISVTYPRGRMFPVGPITVNNAATLNPGTVTLRYPAQPGATGYIIIRRATPIFPVTGTCNACASATVTGIAFADTGLNTPNNFAASGIQPASQQLRLNNRNMSLPYIETLSEFYIAPPRGTQAYSYLFNITDGARAAMIGGRDQKTYALAVNVSRPLGFGASGDSNDAIFRGSYSNRALNDNNFIMRAINTNVTNRATGRVGIIEGAALGASNQDGTGIVQSIRGLAVNPENFGTVVNEFSGIDVALKNEGAVATLEYGVRVRNINNSLATAANAAFLVSDTGANIGFSYGLDMGGATIGIADVRGESLDTIANAAAGYWTVTRGSGAFTGLTIQATAFADLPAAANGTIMYCSNCDPAIAGAGPTVCASAGAATGSMAFRINGAWTCLGI